MPRSLAEFLNDILSNIDRVEGHLAGRTQDDLVREPMFYDAVERCIERISEASRGIPNDIKSLYPAVPWHDIASIGNRIRHGYFAVDASISWQTVTVDLASLKPIAVDKAKHAAGS